MSRWQDETDRVIPAHLDFLTIYNPALGNTDETRQDQILFYYSSRNKKTHRRKSSRFNNKQSQDSVEDVSDTNEQLRQVGLAQGMVAFARNFAAQELVESVETEKCRIVLTELETGWWILASIQLTRLPIFKAANETAESKKLDNYEYSAREVSPSPLLLQQLRRAYRAFLLHHGSNLADIFARLGRSRFCTIAEQFWAQFAQDWDVLLHGNPTTDFYAGIKIAAGGELGIGVGEEDYGSGQRAFLEGMIASIDGLEDIIVSRFGDAIDSKTKKQLQSIEDEWFGINRPVKPEDGIIFRGVGTFAHVSIRAIAEWVESIYCHGYQAYGVFANPSSKRNKRIPKDKDTQNQLKKGSESLTHDSPSQGNSSPRPFREESSPSKHSISKPNIPPPIVSSVEESLQKTTEALNSNKASQAEESNWTNMSSSPLNSISWTKYLTLGYGSSWGTDVENAGTKSPSSANQTTEAETKSDNDKFNKSEKAELEAKQATSKESSQGRFIVGFEGAPEVQEMSTEKNEEFLNSEGNDRLSLRTIYVLPRITTGPSMAQSNKSIESSENETSPSRETSSEHDSQTRKRKIRVVVYIHQPFIYAFLFDPSTSSLAMPSFYKTIQEHLEKLHNSLVDSTSPKRANEKLLSALATQNLGSPPETLYSLNFDPETLALVNFLPNIPFPENPDNAHKNLDHDARVWSRAEALSTHTQIISMTSSSRNNLNDRERQAKTSRGWWILWTQLSHKRKTYNQFQERHQDSESYKHHKEAILIRRAVSLSTIGTETSDRSFSMTTGLGLGRLIGRETTDTRNSNAATHSNPAKLAEGIGIDAKKYVEGLFNMIK